MQGVDPKDGTALREVALNLQQRFCPEPASGPGKAEDPAPPKRTEPKDKGPVVVNAPLDFELKGLDAEHPYLLNRGFTPETIERFGLGYCGRGLLKSRIAIPLYDAGGKLIGYAGRVVDDSAITEDNPRYRFPGERKRDGTVFEFRKTLFLYNGYRIPAPVDDLIVTEGFTGVWWLDQHGFPSVVATMGADWCSHGQLSSLGSRCFRIAIIVRATRSAAASVRAWNSHGLHNSTAGTDRGNLC